MVKMAQTGQVVEEKKGSFVRWASSAGKEETSKASKPSEDEEEALREYVEKFGEVRDGTHFGYNRVAFPWFTPQKPHPEKATDEALYAALEFKDKPTQKLQVRKQKLWDVDSDGEEIPLCGQCFLPVGEFSYYSKQGKDSCVHAECMAQIVIQEAQEEEEERACKEDMKKLKSRKEYDIGWKMNSVPKSAAIAEKLGCKPVPQALCCLVYDEASSRVRIAATQEPAAAVNLEYLLLALKVRKHACREPLFSLDPVDPKNLETTPQKKRYEPAWIAGTSVGDVMFQADYFLKELALGEYTMPVLGMLSVFDWSELEASDRQWAGREWFVVKKAEVHLAQDNTLIPHVKMGVEAREQVMTKKGLEDAPVTGPNHPLKKFAEAFTRNFDVIAERKSVVFHLRELAKASVLAKFLVDSKARVDDSWYSLADEIVAATKPEAFPEIPQLWNMRGNTCIQLKGGRLMNLATGGKSSLQAIYGGVEFGLDRFELAQRHALQTQQMQAGPQGMQIGGSGRPMFMPQRFQLGQRETPQGVDLNLDKFGLSKVDRFSGSLPACSLSLDAKDAQIRLGRAFLKNLEDASFAGMKDEDVKLLKGLFNYTLADRMQEGDAFIPPDPNVQYVSKVRAILSEEKGTRERRARRFLDKSFVPGDAGREFPRSWTSRFQVERDGQKQAIAPGKYGLVQVQVDAYFEQILLDEILPTAAPEFNGTTEDGMVFRIYRIGSLEVRTTQELGEAEKLGVVYSSREPSWQQSSGKKAKELPEDELLVKAKLYVEAQGQELCTSSYRYYIVIETGSANCIVTERLSTGLTTWAVNPEDMEDRNSLARLLFTVNCKAGVSVSDLKSIQAQPEGASPADSKNYTQVVFQRLCGRGLRGKWGGYLRLARRSAGSKNTDSRIPKGVQGL
mmetsp:Transcript_45441/g.81761  ORF Transcript_45441/g.81761 Transcript_45441/m.81761 type:complete len:902 (+) Transcript_45441:67-2772(+)